GPILASECRDAFSDARRIRCLRSSDSIRQWHGAAPRSSGRRGERRLRANRSCSDFVAPQAAQLPLCDRIDPRPERLNTAIFRMYTGSQQTGEEQQVTRKRIPPSPLILLPLI